MTTSTIEGIEIKPKVFTFPKLSFLRDETVFKEYKDRIKRYGEKARKNLDVLTYQDGIIQNLNPFADVELGQIVRIASPYELMRAIEINSRCFWGYCINNGLVLRTKNDSYKRNNYLAEHLARQTNIKFPARISLQGLKLKEDNKSDYGLVFLINDAEVINVPEFSYKNNQKRFSETDERGVPIFEDNGSRTFYARKNGLSVLYSFRDLDLYSNCEYLANSDSGDRVAVIIGEATSQKIINYTNKTKTTKNIDLSTLKELNNQILEEIIKLEKGIK